MDHMIIVTHVTFTDLRACSNAQHWTSSFIGLLSAVENLTVHSQGSHYLGPSLLPGHHGSRTLTLVLCGGLYTRSAGRVLHSPPTAVCMSHSSTSLHLTDYLQWMQLEMGVRHLSMEPFIQVNVKQANNSLLSCSALHVLAMMFCHFEYWFLHFTLNQILMLLVFR